MRKFLYIAFLFISLLPLHLSAQDENRIITEQEIPDLIKDSKEELYKYYYFEAIRQSNTGNNDSALVLLQKCLETDSLAPEGHYSISRIYSRLGNDSIAIRHLKIAVETDSLNDEFAESLGQYYLEHSQIDEANKIYERLYAMCPDRSEYLDILSKTYQYQRDYKKLLHTLNRIETIEGQSEELTLTKMQVYSMMGDEEEAYDELTKLVVSHPNDLNYKVMKGNWLLSNGRKDEAHEIFNEVLKEEPSNANAQMSLMDYYRMQGQNEEADELLYAILENPGTQADTRIALMRQAVRDNEAAGEDSLRILNIFSRVLALPQKTSEMAEMQHAYMSMKNMPQDSIKASLHRILEINPDHIAARLQLIEMMWRDTVDNNLIRECEKAVDYIPNEPVIYYFLGIAKYLNDDIPGAKQALQTGVSKIAADTNANVASEMYMILGDILYKEKHINEACAAYDSCLTYNGDNISCLNNYAYYLSVLGTDLKKAEEMSRKTITAEPQNTTYLDTYAWVLYKLQRYEEARIYIDQVLKLDSGNVSDVELEHAGDIYIKVGDKAKAKELWQQALEKTTDNAATLRKKIKKVK